MFIKQEDGDNVTMWVDLCKCVRYGLNVWKGSGGELHTLTVASEDGKAKFLGLTLGELKKLRYRLDRYITGFENGQ